MICVLTTFLEVEQTTTAVCLIIDLIPSLSVDTYHSALSATSYFKVFVSQFYMPFFCAIL